MTIMVATAHQAQLAEKLGFQAVGISGANTSTELLGLPDAGFLTMTEMVQNVERICRAVNLPVRVDCETGFGNDINVRRTVDSVIRAGAAALFIEDQVAPKRCGFVKGKELISLEERWANTGRRLMCAMNWTRNPYRLPKAIVFFFRGDGERKIREILHERYQVNHYRLPIGLTVGTSVFFLGLFGLLYLVVWG